MKPGNNNSEGVKKDLIVCQVVTYNSELTIQACIQSLRALDQDNFEIILIIIDNASSDSTKIILDNELKNSNLRIKVHLKDTNLGFSRAHNIATHDALQMGADFIVLVNPDLVLEKSCVRRMHRAFGSGHYRKTARIAAVTPRLYRTDNSFSKADNPLLDCAGMYFVPSFRHFDRGSNDAAKVDSEEIFAIPEFVSGGSGACLMCSREFIEDVSFPPEIRFQGDLDNSENDEIYKRSEFLDEAFVMYREDAELSLRAKLLGWRYRYEPAAEGYHVRRVFHDTRAAQSERINSLGVQNRFLLQVQLLSPLSFILLCPMILIRNVLVVLACLLKERTSIAGIKNAIKLAPQALKKNFWIKSRTRSSMLSFVSLFYSGTKGKTACEFLDESSLPQVAGMHISIVSHYQSASLMRYLQKIIEELEGCKKELGIPWKISITNNSPGDPDFKILKTRYPEFPNINYIEPQSNVGFAEAHNEVLLKDHDSDIFLILNPDLMPESGAFTTCVRELGRIGNLGTLSPVLIDAHTRLPQRAYLGRRLPSFWSVFLNAFFIESLWPDNPVSRYCYYEDEDVLTRALDGKAETSINLFEVEHLAGACLFVPSSVFKSLGGFDKSFYPAWYEDVDFSNRVKNAGLVSVLLPDAKVVHEGGSSENHLGKNRLLTLYYLSERVYWINKIRRKDSFLPLCYLAVLLSAFAYLTRRILFTVSSKQKISILFDDLKVFFNCTASQAQMRVILENYASREY